MKISGKIVEVDYEDNTIKVKLNNVNLRRTNHYDVLGKYIATEPLTFYGETEEVIMCHATPNQQSNCAKFKALKQAKDLCANRSIDDGSCQAK